MKAIDGQWEDPALSCFVLHCCTVLHYVESRKWEVGWVGVLITESASE